MAGIKGSSGDYLLLRRVDEEKGISGFLGRSGRSGYLGLSIEEYNNRQHDTIICPECNGNGKKLEFLLPISIPNACSKCGGLGKIKRSGHRILR